VYDSQCVSHRYGDVRRGHGQLVVWVSRVLEVPVLSTVAAVVRHASCSTRGAVRGVWVCYEVALLERSAWPVWFAACSARGSSLLRVPSVRSDNCPLNLSVNQEQQYAPPYQSKRNRQKVNPCTSDICHATDKSMTHGAH